MAKKEDEGCSYDACKVSKHFSTQTFPDTHNIDFTLAKIKRLSCSSLASYNNKFRQCAKATFSS